MPLDQDDQMLRYRLKRVVAHATGQPRTEIVRNSLGPLRVTQRRRGVQVAMAFVVMVLVAAPILGFELLRARNAQSAIPANTGLVGQVRVVGGPAAGIAPRQPVVITVSEGGSTVVSRHGESAMQLTIAVAQGTYLVSATDGDAECSTATVAVTPGRFSSFLVTCSIR